MSENAQILQKSVSSAVTCSDGEEGLVDLVNADIIDLVEADNEAIAANEGKHTHQSPGQQRPVYALHEHLAPQQPTFQLSPDCCWQQHLVPMTCLPSNLVTERGKSNALSSENGRKQNE